ncbi:hypothetical protein [Haloplanus halophilus]|uniref:hypothetical protein n=1 Tax=Haloplanus halophilus TaxID=2949993 RepID=UPI00203CF75D|nr:hypothetical protein [Haloplanus sp. GDY1]
MATRGTRESGIGGAQLPGVVPFDLANLTRLSWELGARVVDDEASALRGEWAHAGSPWEVSVFDVASETAAVRVRTPTGRERFYGAARMDLDAALPALDAAADWDRRS